MIPLKLVRTIRLALPLAVCAPLFALAPAAQADDAAYDATLKDIQATFGSVPTFVKAVPKAALPGAWQEEKMLELSDQTALPAKTKALISLAVAAQIPCEYCIWIDTMTARKTGATEEEIGEAVAMAALTRHWSTIFHGLQVDLRTFKQELGGDAAAK